MCIYPCQRNVKKHQDERSFMRNFFALKICKHKKVHVFRKVLRWDAKCILINYVLAGRNVFNMINVRVEKRKTARGKFISLFQGEIKEEKNIEKLSLFPQWTTHEEIRRRKFICIHYTVENMLGIRNQFLTFISREKIQNASE